MDDEDSTKIWTLVAALLRLLDNNPHVFRETSEENSPHGSRFVAGHSMEDFSRALAVWVAFQSSRCREAVVVTCTHCEVGPRSHWDTNSSCGRRSRRLDSDAEKRDTKTR